MDDDGGIGDVQQPVRVIESKAGEEVPWSGVAEGGVAHATAKGVEDGGHRDADKVRFFHDLCFRRGRGFDGVLDFDQDVGVQIGEGYVSESLEDMPDLLGLAD